MEDIEKNLSDSVTCAPSSWGEFCVKSACAEAEVDAQYWHNVR